MIFEFASHARRHPLLVAVLTLLFLLAAVSILTAASASWTARQVYGLSYPAATGSRTESDLAAENPLLRYTDTSTVGSLIVSRASGSTAGAGGALAPYTITTSNDNNSSGFIIYGVTDGASTKQAAVANAKAMSRYLDEVASEVQSGLQVPVAAQIRVDAVASPSYTSVTSQGPWRSVVGLFILYVILMVVLLRWRDRVNARRGRAKTARNLTSRHRSAAAESPSSS